MIFKKEKKRKCTVVVLGLPELHNEQSVFVPEILHAIKKVKIVQIRPMIRKAFSSHWCIRVAC